MDALQYCRDRVLVPGNTMHLIQHFLDPALLSKLVVLKAFYSDIASIPERVSESSVARTKLGWWQDEIQRCWQGEGRHPISQAAAQEGIPDLVSAEDMMRLVVAVAATIDPEPIASVDELLDYCGVIGGMAARIEAGVCGANQEGLDTAFQLGTGHYLVALIRDISLDARAGRWFIPMDLQARFQFGSDQARAAEESTDFSNLVISLTDSAKGIMDQALSKLPVSQKRVVRHLIIQSALDGKLNEKLASNPNKILGHRIQLSPFGSLWTVWRAARQSSGG